jgi:hypothetical protein
LSGPNTNIGNSTDYDGITNIVEYALGQKQRVFTQPEGVLPGNTITSTKGADAIANGGGDGHPWSPSQPQILP